MTIKNFNTPIIHLDGTPFTNNDKPVLLNKTIGDILCENYHDENQSLSGIDKYKRAKLALKIYDGETDFTTDELTMIKDVIGKRAITIVVYQVFNILDGE